MEGVAKLPGAALCVGPEGCKHLISHSNSVAQSDPLLLKRHIKRDGLFFFSDKRSSRWGGRGIGGRLERIFDRSYAGNILENNPEKSRNDRIIYRNGNIVECKFALLSILS